MCVGEDVRQRVADRAAHLLRIVVGVQDVVERSAGDLAEGGAFAPGGEEGGDHPFLQLIGGERRTLCASSVTRSRLRISYE